MYIGSASVLNLSLRLQIPLNTSSHVSFIIRIGMLELVIPELPTRLLKNIYLIDSHSKKYFFFFSYGNFQLVHPFFYDSDNLVYLRFCRPFVGENEKISTFDERIRVEVSVQKIRKRSKLETKVSYKYED